MLTLLGFTSKQTSVILDLTKQRVANIKSSINSKLFGDDSAKNLYANIISKKWN